MSAVAEGAAGAAAKGAASCCEFVAAESRAGLGSPLLRRLSVPVRRLLPLEGAEELLPRLFRLREEALCHDSHDYASSDQHQCVVRRPAYSSPNRTLLTACRPAVNAILLGACCYFGYEASNGSPMRFFLTTYIGLFALVS